jgi:hypothetical protein
MVVLTINYKTHLIVFNIFTSDIYLIAIIISLSIFYCSKRQKDKTQVKQLRQSSPITYITKYTIEHNNI